MDEKQKDTEVVNEERADEKPEVQEKEQPHVLVVTEADELTFNDDVEKDEFIGFFNTLLNNVPANMASVLAKAFRTSKKQAEKLYLGVKDGYESIFDSFLVGVEDDVRRKTFGTIHAAMLTAAVIGTSPIPFSDAFLLVPVQLLMMGRLHKAFNVSWMENLGSALIREMTIVSLGRSAAGNLLKLIPVVGTVAGAAVNATVAMAITGALGWVTVKMLNDGEDIFDNVMSFKGQFNTLFNALKKSEDTKKS